MRGKYAWRKFLSILMCAAMLAGFLPEAAMEQAGVAAVHTHAWDDVYGNECGWFCGHIIWDDENYCENCEACEECLEGQAAPYHCVECGACNEISEICEGCNHCEDCAVANGWHCAECGECDFGADGANLCLNCRRCANCVDFCEECGYCVECAVELDAHCPLCGECESVTEMCGNNGDVTHCLWCHEVCDLCGRCDLGDGVEFCPDCGLCTECCEENSVNAGCPDGSICEQNAEFEEHLCADCGEWIEDGLNRCPDCGLCLECCVGYSACSQGLCVENTDYEEHICVDCGACFHDVEQCATCLENGEYRCRECCIALCEERGCICGDQCINSDAFGAHLSQVHSETAAEHTSGSDPVFRSRWEYDEAKHYKKCMACESLISQGELTQCYSGHVESTAHVWDASGSVCIVCGYKKGSNLFSITREPFDRSTKVPLSFHLTDANRQDWPKATFRVGVNYPKEWEEVSYCWYTDGGEEGQEKSVGQLHESALYEMAVADGNWESPELTVYVENDICFNTWHFWCKIGERIKKNGQYINQSGEDILVTRKAALKGLHNYVAVNVKGTGTAKTITIGNEKITITPSEGHRMECYNFAEDNVGLDPQNMDWGCTAYKKIVIGHNYGSLTLAGTDTAGKTWYKKTCKDCGYSAYVEKHEHYYFDDNGVECDEDRTASDEAHMYHYFKCLYPGCDHVKAIPHNYVWRVLEYPLTADEKGAVMRECLDCGYWENQFAGYQVSEEEGLVKEWRAGNFLVTAGSYGYVSHGLVPSKGTFTIKEFDPDSLYYKKRAGKKITGWTATLTTQGWNSAHTSIVSTVLDVTNGCNITCNNDGTWTVYLNVSSNKGGYIGLEPILETCNHDGGTRIEGAVQPICDKAGYTGDTVCNGCGKLLKTGDPIPAKGTTHEGTLTLIEGTAKTGTCTVKGYEGDYRCSACKSRVAGKSTGYQHKMVTLDASTVKTATCDTDGYSGDYVCGKCQKVAQKGHIIKAYHANTSLRESTVREATEYVTGYTGDTYCDVCDTLVKYGHTTPKTKYHKVHFVSAVPATGVPADFKRREGENIYTSEPSIYPKADGYVCGGYYLDEEYTEKLRCGKSIYDTQMGTMDMNIYIKWDLELEKVSLTVDPPVGGTKISYPPIIDGSMSNWGIAGFVVMDLFCSKKSGENGVTLGTQAVADAFKSLLMWYDKPEPTALDAPISDTVEFEAGKTYYAFIMPTIDGTKTTGYSIGPGTAWEINGVTYPGFYNQNTIGELSEKYTVADNATDEEKQLAQYHMYMDMYKQMSIVVPITCEEPDTHTWNAGTVTKAATCTEAGEMTYTCKDADCTETKLVIIPAKGHIWGEGAVTTAPGCDTAGVVTYTCSVCGGTRTQALSPLGHEYGAWSYADEKKHTRVCVHDAAHTESASHSWGAGTVTKAATCAEDGVMTYTCSVCGGTRTRAIPATGHSWSSYTVTKAASCTETGTATGTCSVCGETVTETLEMAEHTWNEGVATKAASCTENGEKTYTCTVCNGTKTETVPKTGHSWDAGTVTKEATCTAAGEKTFHCANCEETRTEAIAPADHDWGGWTVIKEATETEEGEEQRVCKNSDAHVETRVIPVKGHVHTLTLTEGRTATCEATGNTAYYTCSGCGRYFSDAAGTTEIELSQTVVAALGHDWGEWTVVTPATEDAPGEEQRVCKRDATHVEKRAIPVLNHVHTLVHHARVEATATKPGNIEYWECSECRRYFSDSEGKKEISQESTVIPAGGKVPENPLKDGEEYISASDETIYVVPTVIDKEVPVSVTVDGQAVALNLEYDYLNAVTYTGGKILPEEVLEVELPLDDVVSQVAFNEGVSLTAQDVFKVTYVKSNNKEVSRKKKATFYAKLTINKGVNKQMSKAEYKKLKKLVTQANKALKKNKCEFTINPMPITECSPELVAKFNKDGTVKVAKKTGLLSGVKGVWVTLAKRTKLAKSSYTLDVPVTAEDGSVTVKVTGKKNYTGTAVVEVKK